jgi:hypothetical protein
MLTPDRQIAFEGMDTLFFKEYLARFKFQLTVSVNPLVVVGW